MGNTNTLPVVSQIKSTVQLVTGDVRGALETQEKFLHECPGVAQLTSVVELVATDDVAKFKETNLRSVKTFSNAADGLPVVGHVKAVVHKVVGDDEGAMRAVNSANRSTAVIGGGVGGFLVGGPIGAVAGGISGGAAMDGVMTGVDSAVNGKFTPHGFIAAVDNAIENPSGGAFFDALAVPVMDGVAGYFAGQQTAKIQNGVAKSQLADVAGKRDTMQAKLDAAMFDGKITDGQAIAQGAKINQLTNKITRLESKIGALEPFTDPKTGVTHQIKPAKAIPKTTAAKCGMTATTVADKQQEQEKDRCPNMQKLQELLDQMTITEYQWTIIEELVDKCCPSNFTEPTLSMLKQQQRSSAITMQQLLEKTARYVNMCQRAMQGKCVQRDADEDEEEEDEDDDKIRCLHWNINGISAQLKTDIGFIPWLLMYKPHIILLNEIKAKDWLVEALAGVLGYRVIHVPSSAPNKRSMRGSAIFYRNSKKYICTLRDGKQMEWKNGAPEVEMVWADITLRQGQLYRLVSAYVLRDAHFKVVSQEFEQLADEAYEKVTVIAGDLNMKKSKFLSKWRSAGFTDLLKPDWVTNVTSAHGSETCIDYVMVPTGEESHVDCWEPVRLGGKNFHLPIPFTIGHN